MDTFYVPHHLGGIRSFRHWKCQNIHIYAFGDDHRMKRKACDHSMLFTDYIKSLLTSDNETFDVFLEYEYITPSFPYRLRCNGENTQDVDCYMFQHVYATFADYLRIDKMSHQHRFHYCDVRSYAFGDAVYSIEVINIILDFLLDHRDNSWDHNKTLLLRDSVLKWSLVQNDIEAVLSILKIKKQFSQWNHQEMAIIIIDKIRQVLQENRLSSHELKYLYDLNPIQHASNSFFLSTIQAKVRSLCNTLVDAYTIGRMLRQEWESRIRILYMGEDHIDSIQTYLLEFMNMHVIEERVIT